MPTTSNFGWTTPADTDLVKDGAAAIRTLGNGIDTSLVDLKGGTTGQYLVKQSNTDLDFTWTTNTADIDGITATSPLTGGGTSGTITVGIQDGTTAQKGAVQLTDSISSTSTTTAATPNSVKTAYDLANGAIAKSLVDAKADLITATADNTPARLAVGNNGETLVADSSATTGLRWQGNYAAGKNIVINGGMDIWQRGTSSSSLGNYFTADRWYQGAWSGTGTWARESTVVPAGSQYSAKFTASATAQPYFIQAIETANAVQLAGKTVTLSALVAASTSTGFSLTLSHSSNVDNALTGSWTDITATSGGTATATSTTFVTLSGVYSIPSTAKSLRLVVQTTSTIANTVVVYIGQVQLEEGSVRTSFSRAGGTLAGELAACQRYYYRAVTPENAYGAFGTGMGRSGTTAYGLIPFPVPMRTTPTSIEYSTVRIDDGSASTGSATAISINSLFTSRNLGALDMTFSTGVTQYRPYVIEANNSTAAYVAFSAEL